MDLRHFSIGCALIGGGVGLKIIGHCVFIICCSFARLFYILHSHFCLIVAAVVAAVISDCQLYQLDLAVVVVYSMKSIGI